MPSHLCLHHSPEEISVVQEINTARVQLKILQEESFLGHSPHAGEQLWSLGLCLFLSVSCLQSAAVAVVRLEKPSPR